MVGACECGSEPLGSIKCREFLDKDLLGRSVPCFQHMMVLAIRLLISLS